jgi:hypothetical protein
MIVAEKIARKVENLPVSVQVEVLDFVEFVAKKNHLGEVESENSNWSEFSLNQAMKGMENEDFPEYSEADLKEVWR